jgi:uncharacterized membrane protein YfcA
MTTVLIEVVIFIASIIGTVSGFGIATILIPLLVSFFPLPQALFFSGIIHFVNDLWKLIFFGSGIRWRLLLLFGGFGLVASFIGAQMAVMVSAKPLIVAFGVFCVCYSCYLLINPSFMFKASVATATVGGVISGFFAGIFGMGGATRVLFLSAFNLDKMVFLATVSAIGLVIDSARLITYHFNNVVLAPQLMAALAWGIPISFVGAKVGEFVVRHISQKQFRAIIAICLFLLGIKLLLYDEVKIEVDPLLREQSAVLFDQKI